VHIIFTYPEAVTFFAHLFIPNEAALLCAAQDAEVTHKAKIFFRKGWGNEKTYPPPKNERLEPENDVYPKGISSSRGSFLGEPC